MQNKFGLSVGFSDHTTGNISDIIARTLGASIIEKHFTIDKNMEGPDHKASLTPDELELYINKIRETETILGNGIKICQISEMNIRKISRRSIAISKNMKKNEIIKEEYIVCLRPNCGIPANRYEDIIGKRVTKNINKFTILLPTDLQNFF